MKKQKNEQDWMTRTWGMEWRLQALAYCGLVWRVPLPVCWESQCRLSSLGTEIVQATNEITWTWSSTWNANREMNSRSYVNRWEMVRSRHQCTPHTWAPGWTVRSVIKLINKEEDWVVFAATGRGFSEACIWMSAQCHLPSQPTREDTGSPGRS